MASRLCSSLALNAQAVAIGWELYRLKQDPLLLGLLGLAEAAPAISGSFVSGYVVDSGRPALIYRLSLLALLLNGAMLFATAFPALGFSVDARVFSLFAGAFISGAARSFSAPSVFSLIPQLLPRRLMGAAAAMNSSTYQIAAIAGPAAGGFVYAWGGGIAAFAISPAFLAIALLANFRLSPKASSFSAASGRREPFFASVATGLKFSLRHKVLLSTMLLDMFSVLFGGAVAVLPVFADQVFKGGPMSLGFLRAAPSAGSAAVAIWLAFRPMRAISGGMLLWVVAGFGAATIAFALSPGIWLACFCLAASGAFDGVSMVIRGTILQLLTPESMRGRVSAVSSVFITSSNEIGAFESGLAARAMGLVSSVIFGGSMTLGVVAVTRWLSPELARTRLSQSESAAEQEPARTAKDERSIVP